MISDPRKYVIFAFMALCLVSNAQSLTYYKDIQPIITSKCATCHKPGESTPFSLLTYEDVAKRASFIKEVVQKKFMPPWKADNNYVHFANDRSLTGKEIAAIVQWVDNKAPAGTRRGEQPDSATLTGTTYTRKPDMVLMSKDTFHVKGNNAEVFTVFKIPFELKDSQNVEAIEFYCNDKKLIHHANYAVHAVPDSISLYNTSSFINLTDDDRERAEQYKVYEKTIAYYGGWIPGSGYESFPNGFGWVMPKRGVILLTVHYAPSAIDTNSICGVNLFFTKTPIQRNVKIISFGSGGIGEHEIFPTFFILANQTKSFRLDVTNPGEDFSILTVWPHMHYLGKEFTAYLTQPNGDTVKLVHIPQWDFRWQDIYKFKHLVKVPRGSTIHIVGTYDNTSANPFNPHNPPVTVASFGDMLSTDEMLTLLMIFLPYKPGDENLQLE